MLRPPVPSRSDRIRKILLAGYYMVLAVFLLKAQPSVFLMLLSLGLEMVILLLIYVVLILWRREKNWSDKLLRVAPAGSFFIFFQGVLLFFVTVLIDDPYTQSIRTDGLAGSFPGWSTLFWLMLIALVLIYGVVLYGEAHGSRTTEMIEIGMRYQALLIAMLANGGFILARIIDEAHPLWVIGCLCLLRAGMEPVMDQLRR